MPTTRCVPAPERRRHRLPADLQRRTTEVEQRRVTGMLSGRLVDTGDNSRWAE